MTNALIFLYLANIATDLKVLALFVGVIFAIIAIFYFLGNKLDNSNFSLKKPIIGCILAFSFAIILPPSIIFYAKAGEYVIKDTVTSEIGTKIEKAIDKYIEKNLK